MGAIAPYTMDANDLGEWLSHEELDALDNTMTFPCKVCLGPADCMRRCYLGMMLNYGRMRRIDRNQLTPASRAALERNLRKWSRRLVKVRRSMQEFGVDIPSLKEHVGY